MALGHLTIIDSDADTSHIMLYETGRNIVEYGNTRYVFFVDENRDLAYRKSVDNGRSFPTSVIIHPTTTYEKVVFWFDRWTPGDNGTVVHIWGLESASDDVLYFSLDISTDTLGNSGTAIVVFAGATMSTTSDNVDVSGAKARGGNLYCAFNIDDGTEAGFYRSTDAGATWGSRAPSGEAAINNDRWLLFPGNEADNQDMWMVFWDASADEISLKTYDDSGDSWSETSIATSMVEASRISASAPQFYGTIRHSDNHLLLAAWSARDTATADLKTWDINGSGSKTAKTDVHTDVDDCQCIILTLDPNGNVHATYVGKGDGSETVSTAVTINRKVSTDGMTTWGAEFPVFDDFLQPVALLLGSLQSASNWPLAVWPNNDWAAAQDSLVGAYRPVVTRSISRIGV